jgi:hypothetical protein
MDAHLSCHAHSAVCQPQKQRLINLTDAVRTYAPELIAVSSACTRASAAASMGTYMTSPPLSAARLWMAGHLQAGHTCCQHPHWQERCRWPETGMHMSQPAGAAGIAVNAGQTPAMACCCQVNLLLLMILPAKSLFLSSLPCCQQLMVLELGEV